MEYQIRRRHTDRISELPDELLLRILSLLTSKDVVTTSALSKRWRSLWKEVKIFRYDGETSNTAFWRFALFISRRSNVEKLQLKVNPNVSNLDIQSLVNIAVVRSLRELRIEMICNSFDLPESLFLFSKLETVILEKVSLVDVPPYALLTCLKSLHLLSVCFSGDQSVETLLRICIRLEDLVVKRMSSTNVKIFTINVPTLRNLSIDNSTGKSRPNGVHGFVIKTPRLMNFSIRDSFSNYLRFKHMPKLVKASVNVVCDQPNKFLVSLASTQYMSLCSVTSQTPYPPTGTSFLFLEHLELCSCSAEWLNLLTLMLNDAPRLGVLKLKLDQKHLVQNTVMEPWNQPSSVPECLSSHLEIFEWRQYNGTEQERKVAEYILGNARHLKKATFYSESADKHGMSKELECVARGSKTCDFVFK